MNTEILGVVAQIVLMIVLSYPLGKYMARVYKGEKVWSDFMQPVENLIFRFSGIHPQEEMNWKQFLKALLVVNLFWFIWGMILLVIQGSLPLNPDGNGGQTVHQAFNTCISFMVNCNEQHYSGESNLTYFTQLFVIMLFQFITAATGMAAMAGIMKALGEKTTKTIGNFWNYLVLSCTRILLPLSLVVGFILITQGTPMGFDGKMEITTLEGGTQHVSQGPAAAIIPIKQLGTNGGGYYGVNSSHPLENPTYLSNMVECCSILILPMAMVFAFGFYVKRRRLGYSIYCVMLAAFLIGVCVNVPAEMKGNPRMDAMGIAQDNGAMEGKEVRLGAGATGLWSVATTVTSNGSVNGMHDSTMPVSGMIEMLNMQINTWFGGVGVGWMNYFTFIIIAVFISGLMVGRTPEFLCHKVEAREMKVASMVALLHPFVILVGTALAAYLYVHAPEWVESEGGWLNNPGLSGRSRALLPSSPLRTVREGFPSYGSSFSKSLFVCRDRLILLLVSIVFYGII
jgi:potassium-transporting ATPase potassium-binding subunit